MVVLNLITLQRPLISIQWDLSIARFRIVRTELEVLADLFSIQLEHHSGMQVNSKKAPR